MSCTSKTTRYLTTRGKYTIYLKPDQSSIGCGSKLCGDTASPSNPIFMSELQSLLDTFQNNKQPICVILVEAGTYTASKTISIDAGKTLRISGLGPDVTFLKARFHVKGILNITDCSNSEKSPENAQISQDAEALITISGNGRFSTYRSSLNSSSGPSVQIMNFNDGSTRVSLTDTSLTSLGPWPCLYADISGIGGLCTIDARDVNMTSSGIVEDIKIEQTGKLARKDINVTRRSYNADSIVGLILRDSATADWDSSAATSFNNGGYLGLVCSGQATLHITDINHKLDLSDPSKFAFKYDLKDDSQVAHIITGAQVTKGSLSLVVASENAILEQNITNSVMEKARQVMVANMADGASMTMRFSSSSMQQDNTSSSANPPAMVSMVNNSQNPQTLGWDNSALYGADRSNTMFKFTGNMIQTTLNGSQLLWSAGIVFDVVGNSHVISVLNTRMNLQTNDADASVLSIDGNSIFSHFSSITDTGKMTKTPFVLQNGAVAVFKNSSLNVPNITGPVVISDGTGGVQISNSAVFNSGEAFASRLGAFDYSDSNNVIGSNVVQTAIFNKQQNGFEQSPAEL